MKEIKVDLRVKIGSQLEQGFDKIKFGKYTISKLPSEHGSNSELILKFNDVWKDGQEHSNPEREGEILLAWLSVILGQKIESGPIMLNKVNSSKINKEKISFPDKIIFPENINELCNKFSSLPLSEENNLLEKYARACECYQEALQLSSESPNVSFFLFIVSMECLSDKGSNFYESLMKELQNKDKLSKKEVEDIYKKFNEEFGSRKGFVKFIFDNFSEWKNDFSEEEFKNLLSSIYSVRSVFTHKGESLKKYIDLVDTSLKSKTIFTQIGGRKVEFPGLNYLSYLVEKVLINFLENQSYSGEDNLPKLASNDSLVQLVATTDIKKGQLVLGNSIKYRK